MPLSAPGAGCESVVVGTVSAFVCFPCCGLALRGARKNFACLGSFSCGAFLLFHSCPWAGRGIVVYGTVLLCVRLFRRSLL
jgi:hypothetical protein